MIIVLGGQKGGTGKSTLATNIAVAFAHQKADVLLLDADSQKTATYWADRRANTQSDLPQVHCMQRSGENLFLTLKDLAGRYEHIVADTGGHDGVEFRSGMLVSQLVLFPFEPSQAALETMGHVHGVLEQVRAMRPDQGPDARAVLNRAPTHYQNTEAKDAAEYLVAFPGVSLVNARIHDRKAYRDALLEGKGIVEMSNSAAAKEFISFFEEITQ